MGNQLKDHAEKAGALVRMFDSVPRLWASFNTLAENLAVEVAGMVPGDQVTDEMVEQFGKLIEIHQSIHTAIAILQCVPDSEIRTVLGAVILGMPWSSMTVSGLPALTKVMVYLYYHHAEIEQRFEKMTTAEA